MDRLAGKPGEHDGDLRAVRPSSYQEDDGPCSALSAERTRESRRADQRERMRHGESRHDGHHLAQPDYRDDQAEKEEQVIDAAEDVLHAEDHECARRLVPSRVENDPAILGRDEECRAGPIRGQVAQGELDVTLSRGDRNATLHRLGWGWAPLIGARLERPERGERMLFSRLKQWEETAERPPSRTIAIASPKGTQVVPRTRQSVFRGGSYQL